MQNSQFDVHFTEKNDIPALMSLWETAFGDSKDDIKRFFDTAYVPQNSVAVYDGETPVSMLFLLGSDIFIGSVSHSAFYVYAVATDPAYRGRGLMRKSMEFSENYAKRIGKEYLFLVPETQSLFDMYAKLGYIKGITYREKTFYSKDFTAPCSSCEFMPDYESYKALRLASGSDVTVWGEREYEYICSSLAKDKTFIYTSRCDGYCFYEKGGDTLSVLEICGNEKAALSALFNKEKSFKKAVCRMIPSGADGIKKDLGMCKPLSDGDIGDIYFGLPYA